MGDRVRVVQIGCGRWGANLLRTLTAIDPALACGVVDPDPNAQARARVLAPAAAISGELSDLARWRPDAVIVASPDALHASHAFAALELGAHVFVEKPMATCSADAERMAAAASRLGVTGMVGHVLRYHPAVGAVIELLSRGALGRVLELRSERWADRRPAPRASIAPHSAFAPGTSAESRLLWSLGPHDVSLLQAIDPSSVVSADATESDGGMTVNLELRTSNGTAARIELARGRARKARRLWVRCERGVAVFNDLLPKAKARAVISGRLTSLAYDDRVEPLRTELERFLHCLRDGLPCPTSFAEGVSVVAVLERASASMAASTASRPPLVAAR